MNFNKDKYRREVSGYSREKLLDTLVREAELRYQWEREALGKSHPTTTRKKTRTIYINVTSMTFDDMLVKLAERIGSERDMGWHFASSFHMEWAEEDHIICVFCKTEGKG
jgi:hypothetical protein